MAEQYSTAFQELLSQINTYSPRAAQILESILAEGGARAAYYAAFVIVCIHARTEDASYRGETTWSIDQLRNFTFFDYVMDNPQVLSLFNQALNLYNIDQQASV
ncbi:MAG TPA: hypothetical protein VHD90_10105 [Phototrophicaceae bacterium]|nr:hypothetical protein [Phototrophicaceae bacterium]